MSTIATLLHVGPLPPQALEALGLSEGSYVVLRSTESGVRAVAPHLYEPGGVLLSHRQMQIPFNTTDAAIQDAHVVPVSGPQQCFNCGSTEVTHVGYLRVDTGPVRRILGAMCTGCANTIMDRVLEGDIA